MLGFAYIEAVGPIRTNNLIYFSKKINCNKHTNPLGLGCFEPGFFARQDAVRPRRNVAKWHPVLKSVTYMTEMLRYPPVSREVHHNFMIQLPFFVDIGVGSEWHVRFLVVVGFVPKMYEVEFWRASKNPATLVCHLPPEHRALRQHTGIRTRIPDAVEMPGGGTGHT